MASSVTSAETELARCQGELKTAIVAVRKNVTPEVARQLLSDAGGQLRAALES